MTILALLSALWGKRREAAAPAASTAASPASAPAPAMPVAPIPVLAVGDAPAAPAPPPGASAPPAAIEAHRLRGALFDPSPHVGAEILPLFVVMHYTAGGTARSSIRAIADRGLSAHFFIDRDGTVIQTVACNRMAFHAGDSTWRGYNGLNAHSIGIELANLGWLDRRAGAGWTRQGLGRTLPPEMVVVARHQVGGQVMAWEAYPEAQLRAAEALVRAILRAYPAVREVVGHDELSPGRKLDPGPAFPMARFRALVRR
ncbi:N-acetylmuramoyl-L-alanine amidase [Falsiroseomonas selenitidurans]|uniref:N-acetylmuramoyl-L-alanine amidase n=1 Tax=Falsiroseomonas selenitidurans TaxID=2716335 RepID=A0ABX1E8I0_9PROT|nr:N-acetylmuramoyl-L-alanine amidase [Falsiroseomonas selenitidurans]NKC33511.1 N-acetylmuramoyl-L-alanine amidase [Falsiroseomonas selenitidurans]